MYESGILSTWNEPLIEIAANEVLEMLSYEHDMGYEWIKLDVCIRELKPLPVIGAYEMMLKMGAIKINQIRGYRYIKCEDCSCYSGKTLEFGNTPWGRE